MDAKLRDYYLARLDALLGLLNARLKAGFDYFDPPGFRHSGLEHAWADFEDIRAGLIGEDRALFGHLPKCHLMPNLLAHDVTALRDIAEQARTLLTGGDSVSTVDARDQRRLENDNIRLRNWRLALIVFAALLSILAYFLGHFVAVTSTLRKLAP